MKGAKDEVKQVRRAQLGPRLLVEHIFHKDTPPTPPRRKREKLTEGMAKLNVTLPKVDLDIEDHDIRLLFLIDFVVANINVNCKCVMDTMVTRGGSV